MKLKKEENGWILYFNKEEDAFIYLINEWAQIIGRWNWYSFTLIEISAENDITAPGFELTIIILGLGFRLRINRDWSGSELQKRIDDIKKYEK